MSCLGRSLDALGREFGRSGRAAVRDSGRDNGYLGEGRCGDLEQGRWVRVEDDCKNFSVLLTKRINDCERL